MTVASSIGLIPFEEKDRTYDEMRAVQFTKDSLKADAY